jgi:hypothetical protein
MATNKEKFNKKYGFNKNEPHSISEISKLSGIRGVGAWKSNPASVRLKSGQKAPNAPRSAKMGKEQWGVARVYSFVMGGKTRSTADKDLWEKHKK